MEIEAASGEGQAPPTFKMLAYVGGTIMPNGFTTPVVIDLASASVYTPEVSPAYLEHKPDQIVGHGTIVIDRSNNQIRIDDGVISAGNEYAEQVITAAKNGFPWRSSIGAKGGTREYISPGKKTTVNGREFAGPVIVARNVKIGELSFVSLGGERYASATIAANFFGDERMDPEFKSWAAAQGFDVDTLTASAIATLVAAYESQQDSEPADSDSQSGDIQANAAVQDVVRRANELNTQLERQLREAELRNITATYGVESFTLDNGQQVPFIQHAISAGWSVEQARDKARLTQLLESRGTANIHTRGGERVSSDLLQAGIGQAMGVSEEILGLEDSVMQAAHTRWRGNLGIQELLLEAAWANGCHHRRYNGNERDVLQAAFSTVSLPEAMSSVMNRTSLAAYMQVMEDWRSISAVTPASDFKKFDRIRLGGDFKFEKVGATGELRHGKLSEELYENQVDTYGKMMALSRRDIRNDDLGQLNKVPGLLGRGGGLKFNEVFWAEFLADHAAFFTVAKNAILAGADTPWYLISGTAFTPMIETAFLDNRQTPMIESTDADFNTLGIQMRGFFDFGVRKQEALGAMKVEQALSYQSLTDALIEWDKKKDPAGNPFVEEPTILLVPSSYYITAQELMTSSEIRLNSAAKTPTRNIFVGKFQIVKSKYLPN